MNSGLGHNPILVTGSHLSGTTWVGRMLTYPNAVGYIHEPFNVQDDIRRLNGTTAPFRYWFTYLNDENGAGFLDPLQRTYHFHYDLICNFRSAP